MSRQGRPGLADAGALALCAGAPALLGRMRADLLDRAGLRATTAGAMWAAYGAYAALVAHALAAAPTRAALPAAARAGGWALAGAGAALQVAGMSRFSGLSQISATTSEHMITRGIYRYSRNPQYLGALITLAALAALRRSGRALALDAGLASAYLWWVPVEEAHLGARFGPAYQDYLRSTARWLGPARTHRQAR